MLRLLVDENLNNNIFRALLRQKPDLDIVRVQDVNLSGQMTQPLSSGLLNRDERCSLMMPQHLCLRNRQANTRHFCDQSKTTYYHFVKGYNTDC